MVINAYTIISLYFIHCISSSSLRFLFRLIFITCSLSSCGTIWQQSHTVQIPGAEDTWCIPLMVSLTFVSRQKTLYRQRWSCTNFKRVGFSELITLVLEHYIQRHIPTLARHMYDTELVENHSHLLIKVIAETYLQVRYNYEAKQVTQKLRANCTVKSRQVLY